MNNKMIFGILGGVLGLGLIVLIAISAVSGSETSEEDTFGEVTVEGSNLPVFSGETGTDVAAGMTAPTVTGTDFDGSEVTIAPDGRPKVVLLVAHWCPHCQNEVPRVQSWLDGGNQPEGVDFYTVSTMVARLQGNWPPEKWLVEDVGWTVPVIQDDQAGTANQAFGMTGTPFWVVLDGDNNVMARVSGEIGNDAVAALFQAAASA